MNLKPHLRGPIAALLLLGGSLPPAAAQITVTDLTEGPTPQDLADAFAGPGITIVANSAELIQLADPNDSPDVGVQASQAAGTFTGNSSIYGFGSGLILSSGRADHIEGVTDGGSPPNYNHESGISAKLALLGDSQLEALYGTSPPFRDATALQFEFVPNASFITFEFVFASDEYNEYVGSQYNDAFGFFVNGQPTNHAVVGPNDDPVTINAINYNNNLLLYRNNDPHSAPTRTTSVVSEADGLTRVLVSYAAVNANQTNTLKLVIADRSDFIYDSWVLLRGASLSTTNPLVATKVADAPVSVTGGTNGYTISLTNPGSAAVTVTSIEDLLPPGFTYVNSSTTGLTTGNPTSTPITFPDSSVRNRLVWTGSFNVAANSTATLTFDVTVSSTPGTYTNSVDADASVPVIPSGDTAPIEVRPPVDIAVVDPWGNTIEDAAANLDFRSWIVGSKQHPRVFTIRNDGATTNLTGLAVTVSGTDASDFILNTTGMATSLAPGASTTFTLSFRPGASGYRSADLSISSNDPDEDPFEVYFYGYGETTLTGFQRDYLKASNPGNLDQFGSSLDISGNTIVVGAIEERSNATGINAPLTGGSGTQADNSLQLAGAAYVFTRDPVTGVLSQQAYLKASNTGYFDSFGWAVDIDGDTIAVSASREKSNATGINGNQANDSSGFAGAVYIFVRDPATGIWTQQAYIKASNTGVTDWFGKSLSLDGNTLLVGAGWEDSNANTINAPLTGGSGTQADNSLADAGAAYVFTRSGTTWTQQAYLKPPSPAAGKCFGWATALQGDTAVVSASRDTGGGEVHIFTRAGTTWSHRTMLAPTYPDPWDNFGNDLDLSGDTLVVGCFGEDSNATGVNGSETDDSVQDCGAAFVYTGSGATWTQQAFLKSDDPEHNDWFGYGVAIEGDVIAISAITDDSNATGFNGDSTDNSASQAGGVHIFFRNGTTWSPNGYIKASNNEAGDQFGAAMCIQNGSLITGSHTEDSNATGVNGDQWNNLINASGAVYVIDLMN